jgi:hypothetical protein
MKSRPLFIGLAVAVSLAACHRRDRTSEDVAARTAESPEPVFVRVIHAMPEVPPADVYIDDEKVFTNVAFATSSPYKATTKDHFKITLKPTGKDQPVLFEAQQGVKPGARYTIVAMPDRGGAAKLDAFTDEIEAAPSDKATVRIVHAAPEAGDAEVASAAQRSDPEIDHVGYGAPARYEAIDPTDVKVTVEAKPAAARKSKAPAIVADTPVVAGKVYTLVVASGDEPGQPIKVFEVEDSASPAAAARVPAGAPAAGSPTAGERATPAPTENFEIEPDVPNPDRDHKAPPPKR